jgi:hypothetical protein
MRLVSSHIGISLKNSDVRGIILERPRVESQYSRLNPNRGIDLVPECRFMSMFTVATHGDARA